MTEREAIDALLAYAQTFVDGMYHDTQQGTWEQFGAASLLRRLREQHQAGSFDSDPETAKDVSLDHSCGLDGWDEACPECRFAKLMYEEAKR